MKKVINLVKKFFLIVGTFLISVYTKVFAMESPYFTTIQPVYGIPMEPDLYGVPRPNEIPMLWKIARGFIVPLAFIMGIIIYFKKSSSSKAKKIITIFVTLIIVILVCLGINYFITR
ncbi:MAG: hypothetical protein IJB90_00175 [Clostridia bacterium]|nr:hypothetical protein [Clostridia bacterium]